MTLRELKHARIKYAWATENLSNFADEINNFLKSNYSIETDTSTYHLQEAVRLNDSIELPEIRMYSNYLRCKVPAPLNRWALLSDDIINNLRASLDHAIFEIATLEEPELVKSEAGHWGFPIIELATEFPKQTARMLVGLPAEIRNYVESVQTFNNTGSLLLLLHKVSNYGKHRFPQMSVEFLGDYTYSNPTRELNPGIKTTFGNVAGDGSKNILPIYDGMELSPICIHDFEGDDPSQYEKDFNMELVFTAQEADQANALELLQNFCTLVFEILTELERLLAK